VSEQLVVATWGTESKIAIWGPTTRPPRWAPRRASGTHYGLTVAGGTIFYSHDPQAEIPTPGIYQWTPPAQATLFATYAELGGIWTLGHILRATPNKLLFCDTTDVRVVDRATRRRADALRNPGNETVLDIRPARPRTLEAGVLVTLHDATYFETGRDYYVDLSQVGSTPVDLASKADALARASSCWQRRSLQRRRYPLQPPLHL
jgi:hypothetical protein